MLEVGLHHWGAWGDLVASIFLQSSEVFSRLYMTIVFWFILPLSYFCFMFKLAQTSVILVSTSGSWSWDHCQGTCGCWGAGGERLRSIEADTELNWRRMPLPYSHLSGISSFNFWCRRRCMVAFQLWLWCSLPVTERHWPHFQVFVFYLLYLVLFSLRLGIKFRAL